jgi:hypothetical protein
MKLAAISTCLTALTAMLVSGAAHAALITPGQNLFALSEAGPVGATVLATQTIPFVTATYSGSLTSTVLTGDTSNALGGLTFTYAIQNDANSAHAINRLAVNGFVGFATDMSFSGLSGAIAPTLNDRDAGGNVIGFTYIGAPIGPGPIAPGALTNLMVVQTNATNYRATLSNIIDGSIAVVDSFAPVVIPEPVSASALLLTAGLVRRRR